MIFFREILFFYILQFLNLILKKLNLKKMARYGSRAAQSRRRRNRYNRHARKGGGIPGIDNGNYGEVYHQRNVPMNNKYT